MKIEINCPYQSQISNNGRFRCQLGWYGGFPWIGNCIDCIKRGDNTPEAKAAFDAKADRAHPSDKPKVSDCCGSALNYYRHDLPAKT